MNLPAPVSVQNAEHYAWGEATNPCDGWHLVRTPELSVISERMPPGTSEIRHYHERARQFFFVLEGELTIERGGAQFLLRVGDGLEVAPGTPHQVFNCGAAFARFLVISQPPSHGDRVIPSANDRSDETSAR